VDEPVRIAVLLSGGGRTLRNLLDQIAGGRLRAEVVAVVSSVASAGGLAIAAEAGIPAQTVARSAFTSDDAFSEAIYEWLAPYRPELILLAGFLRRLEVPDEWAGRMLNIHPALLPESGVAGRGYYGERVHAAVLASQATVSGATVHVVSDEYDAGPVIMRREVTVHPDDTVTTLAARVFTAECELYPAAIRRYVADHPELFGCRRI
jgi:formyltetrahydrofolate-dependent phosphoribosylglycinamide formyltransferase